LNAVSIYSWEFFTKAISNLAKIAGVNAHNLINELAQAFNIGISEATDVSAQAGYTFSNWVGAVENFLGVNLDYSCIVEISNEGGPYDLILEENHINQGNYAVPPPDRVSAGRISRFWLKDPTPSPFGADGWTQYYYIDSANNRNSTRFTYACPTGPASNVAAASAPFSFYTKSGSMDSGWNGLNQIVSGWASAVRCFCLWRCAGAKITRR
jgi:hypothetical protein